MKVWITKYALTKGVYSVEVKTSASVPSVVWHKTASGYDEHFHGEGKDWHRTEASAIEHAEQMRVNKLASLKKQIAKLEAMTFSRNEEN